MGRRENSTVRIESQKFMRMAKDTMLDFQQLGNNPELVESLENILQTKKLTLLNVSVLLCYIIKRKHFQESVKSLEVLLGSNNEINDVIEKEHKYMLHYISKAFTYEVDNDGNVFCISKKI